MCVSKIVGIVPQIKIPKKVFTIKPKQNDLCIFRGTRSENPPKPQFGRVIFYKA